MHTLASLKAGFTAMAMDRINSGFKPYLMTFLFNPVRGSEAQKKLEMEDEVERFYARLLCHTFRHPKNVDVKDKPLWIYSHDWPVPKGTKSNLFQRDHYANIVLNDGLHGHAIALQPASSRMKRGLMMHIEENQAHIHGPSRAFQRVHVCEVVDNPKSVIGYAIKSLERKRIHPGEILLMPKSKSEISTYDAFDREQQRQTEDSKKAARIKGHAARQFQSL